MWLMWLRDPADEPWECLDRWLRTPHERVFSVAVDPATDARTRTAVGEFCARHGLAPADPVDKVLFFVLTGQAAAHRALDPDFALLAIAYRGAREATQAALRQEMVGAGDVDFVRVIATNRDKDPTDDEIDYLTRQFARAGEWQDLWRLVRDLPLWHAVAAMPLFDRWQPRSDVDRALFDRLAAARPEVVHDLAGELRRIRSAPLSHIPRVCHASFSPDGRELAVISGLEGIFRLVGARLVGRPTQFVPGSVLHLGKTMITVETGPNRGATSQLIRYTAYGNTKIWEGTYRHDGILAMASVGDRFFAARRGELLHGTGDGSLRRVPFAYPLSLATEPASGRVAVGASRELSILDENLRTIARVWLPGIAVGGVHDVVFTGPDRLVTMDKRGRLRRWERAEHTLRVEAEAQVPEHVWSVKTRFLEPGGHRAPALHAFPVVGRVAVAGRGRVAWLDAHTLADADAPPGLPEAEAGMWSSVDGTQLMIVRDRAVHVADLLLRTVGDVVTTPLSRLGLGDLTALLTAAERRDLVPDVRELLDLVRARLEHRFATEISLGATTAVRAAGDDIALGGA
jgi:hypothetical protein